MVSGRRPPAGAALALALLGGIGSVTLAAAAATEYEVKAAYLYYVASYVEWPDDAFSSGSDPIVVAVLGEDPFGPILDDILRNKTVHGRKLVVRRIQSLVPDLRCQILFISSSEEGRLPRVLKALEGTSTLTVGEMEGFAERGGQIALRLEERKVRFGINVAAAQRARLKVSAQLLKLAAPRIGADAASSSS